jgi:hypothetical protein
MSGQEFDNTNLQNQAAVVAQANYSDIKAEINRRKAVNPNDPLIPYLEAARQQKIADQANATATAAATQRTNALELWKTLGVATPEIASILNIPVNTPTSAANISAVEQSIAQQNANTNAYEASTGRMNANTNAYQADTSRINAETNKAKSNQPTKTEQNNAAFASDYQNLKKLSVKDAQAAMNSKWPDMIKQYGPDGAKKLWNSVLDAAIKLDQAKAK